MGNDNLKIGAGVGLLAGAGAGLVKGIKAESKILGHYKPAMNVGVVGSDEFIKEQADYVADGIKKLQEMGKEVTPKLQYKLKDGFRRMAEHLPDVKKFAKNTKIKWVAALAAAGAVVGGLIGSLTKKSEAN